MSSVSNEYPADGQPAESNDAAANAPAEYVFSWKWLLGGIILFASISVIFASAYFYQARNMSNYVLQASEQLEKEGHLTEAVDLLDTYRSSHPEDTRIWQRLTELFNRVIASEGVGFDRYQKAIDVNRSMKARLEGKDLLEVTSHIMKWEWDRGYQDNALTEALELFMQCQRQNIPLETYPLAWQIYTKIKFNAMLFGTAYRPSDMQDAAFPQTMDALLDKTYSLDHTDVELAALYAEFVRAYDNQVYRENSSSTFSDLTEEQRVRKADEIIATIVRENASNPAAYLSRYLYRLRHTPGIIDYLRPGLNEDLAKAIELEPGNIYARIQAAKYTAAQAGVAKKNGDNEAYNRLFKEVIEHYGAISKYHAKNVIGYRYQGDLYYHQNEVSKAIETWTEGAEKIKPLVDTQLHGRLILALLDTGNTVKAQEELDKLDKFLRNFNVGAGQNVALEKQTNYIRQLLQARLFVLESNQLRKQAGAARDKGEKDKVVQLYKQSLTKTRDAVVIYEKILEPFGHFMSDYSIETDNVYYQIVASAFLTYAQILSTEDKWTQADQMYEKAAHLPVYYDLAMLGHISALQRLNRTDDAMLALSEALKHSPDNDSLRIAYAQTLFKNEMSQSPNIRNFDSVEAELTKLDGKKSKLQRPWLIDIMRIQMQYTIDSSSNDPDRAVASQLIAIDQYKKLENMPMPSADGTPSTQRYADNLDFLTTLAGIYSSLSNVHEFERVTKLMREMPNGLVPYYSEMINDAVRRRDKENIESFVNAAIRDTNLNDIDKQQFITIQRNLQTMGDVKTSEQMYKTLEQEFASNPDALGLQAVFTLANNAIDRQDWQAAQTYENRLKLMESAERGTYWRFVQARRILNDNPQAADFTTAKQLQQAIVSIDQSWDKAYVLGAFIEERMPLQEGDTEVARRDREIDLYKHAVRLGNISPAVWDALLGLLIRAEQFDEEKAYREQAIIKKIAIRSNQGRFPQPYDRFYQAVFQVLLDTKKDDKERVEEADRHARSCVLLAQRRKENEILIRDLNSVFGKMFMDEGFTDVAEKYLRAVSTSGGIFVYPLAVCYAKSGRVDDAFMLLLDEIDRMPLSISALVPSILVLLEQRRPSEQVLDRIDELMMMIESGEHDVLAGTLDKTDSEQVIELPVTKRVGSVIIRFPGQEAVPDPSTIKPLIVERTQLPPAIQETPAEEGKEIEIPEPVVPSQPPAVPTM
jgi:hypothetical protein